MALWKLPPMVKVYEALGAVGDGRVHLSRLRQADVISSSGAKTYQVVWSEDMQKITSNDNASYWQGLYGLSDYRRSYDT